MSDDSFQSFDTDPCEGNYFAETLDPVSNASKHQVGGTHYVKLSIQPWDIVDTWGWAERVGYYRGNAVKYLLRIGHKDSPVQEAQKAIHYLEKLIEVLKENT